MILVDTSVVIDFLKGMQNPKVELFDDILGKKVPWGINEFIFQEVLQGAKDKEEFERLREYLNTIPFYSLKYQRQSFERAAMIYFNCRRAGVTIRSTIDILIAETAIENDVAILHNDEDFDHMGEIVKELKIYKEKPIL